MINVSALPPRRPPPVCCLSVVDASQEVVDSRQYNCREDNVLQEYTTRVREIFETIQSTWRHL